MAQKLIPKCTKKTNLLVYEKPKPRCDVPKPKTPFKLPICTAKPKQIKVCTGAELKKMRPPILCECAKPRPSKGLLGLLGLGLKVALAAAAWYVTYDMGIWGTTEDTHELYRRYCTVVKGPCAPKEEKWEPVLCKAEKELMVVAPLAPFKCYDQPPVDLQRQMYNLQNKWNHCVSYVFSSIAEFPDNLFYKIGIKKRKNESEEEEEPEQPCIPYSELSAVQQERLIKNAYKT